MLYAKRVASLSFLIVLLFGLFSVFHINPSISTNTVSAASAGRTLGASTVVALAAGGRSTCALFANGGVKCWGFNGLGTLGYGDTTNRGTSAAQMGTNLPYVDLGTGRTAVAIAAKGWHVCVILDNGSVKCWGNSDGGQLGYGDTVQRGDGAGEMGDNLPTVNLGTGRTAKKIAVSFNTTCAILDNNSLKCWGFNNFGQLGLGDTAAHGSTSGTMGDALPAVNLGTGLYATDIAMGADTTCALLNNATVKCWGSPIYGHGVTQTQIGREPSHMGDALLTFDLGTDVLVQKISVGLNSVCAIYRTTQSATPAAKCWGSNDQGELGYGLTYGSADIRGDNANEMGNALPPIAFGGANPVSLASHGTSNTTTFRCALLSDGSVKCWGGANTNGQLGAGSTAAISGEPSTITHVDVGNGRTVQQIVVGESHACVLLDNSDVKCWGRNSAGQLGLGHSANRGDVQGQMGDALPAVNLGTAQPATATPSPAATATATASPTASPSHTATSLSTSTRTATPTSSPTATSTTNGVVLTPVPQISAGMHSTCLLDSRGKLRCYGANTEGQLGYGNTTNYSTGTTGSAPTLPIVDVSSINTVVDVQLGRDHTCALLDNGTVKCWGNGYYGKLGTENEDNLGDNPGEMGAALNTIALPSGRTAQSIATGAVNTCALLDNGTLTCWGRAIAISQWIDHGRFSNTMGDNLPQLSISSTQSITTYDVGDNFACVVLGNATLKCFGWNQSGALGVPTTTTSLGYSNQMGDALPTVNLGTDVAVRAIAIGDAHVCAIVNTGQIKCWGNNQYGQLGNGSTANLGDDAGEMGDNLPYVNLGSNRTATAISAGQNHTCAVLDNNTLKCWGMNHYGQLGQGTYDHLGDDSGEMGDNLVAIDLGTSTPIYRVTVGSYHTCVMFVDNAVRCFGRGYEGQLGYGDTLSRGDYPEEMGSALPSYSVETGYQPTATVTPTPTAIPTAIPTNTPLPTHTNTPTATRVPMTPTPRLRAGGNSTCLLDSRGKLRCYGYNTSGQLGYGNNANYGDETTGAAPSLPIVDVSATNTIVDVQVGTDHTCALLDNGTVKCWGNGSYGKLGSESTINLGDNSGEMGAALNTIALPSGRTAVSIATGDRNTCALLDNNALACWGNPIGTSDNIQHGSTSNTMGDNLPQLSVSSSHAITAYAVGDLFACVVLDNATLKCFGSNLSGNLGVPTSTSSLGAEGDMGDTLPTVNLGTGVAVRAIALGKNHVCAIVNTGQVKCWGYNQYGQLGNGSTANLGDDAGEMGDNLPFVNLGSGRTATAISAGANHTCAILDNNTLKCWGFNGYGQLGQGTGTTRGDNPGEMGDALAAVNFDSTTTISRVVVGEQHTCVMFVDFTVRCFGRGGDGQLGYGNSDNKGDDPALMGSALPSYSVETEYQPTATNTPTPLATATSTPSATAVATATAVPSATLTASTTRTASKTLTPSRTKSPTKTLTKSKTPTATRSATRTRSLTPTKTATLTASVTRTKAPTLPPSVTRTRTKLLSPTKSPTRTKTLTRTRTPTRRP